MKGYQGGEGSQRQEQIEQQGNDVAYYRHTAKSLLEHVWQGDKDE